MFSDKGSALVPPRLFVGEVHCCCNSCLTLQRMGHIFLPEVPTLPMMNLNSKLVLLWVDIELINWSTAVPCNKSWLVVLELQTRYGLLVNIGHQSPQGSQSIIHIWLIWLPLKWRGDATVWSEYQLEIFFRILCHNHHGLLTGRDWWPYKTMRTL